MRCAPSSAILPLATVSAKPGIAEPGVGACLYCRKSHRGKQPTCYRCRCVIKQRTRYREQTALGRHVAEVVAREMGL